MPDGAENPIEKPSGDPLNPEVMNEAGAVAKRAEHSEKVAPVSGKPSVADAVKGSDLSPENKAKALKLVEPVADSTGIPSGMAAIGYITKKLEHEMLTNEDAKNSRFVQGAYALCKIFENMFGFAFTADDYSSFTSALYPTEKIEFEDEARIKEFLAKRDDLKLLDNYQKTKDKLDRSVDDKEKQGLQKELELSKGEIKKRFGSDADPDALCKEYLAKSKEQLTKEELDKFKDSEAKDAQISSYYVQKQLDILGLVKEGEKENYDPDLLSASLQKTAYENPLENRKYSMFESKNDPSDFFTSLDSGTAIPGTVVFFRWNVGGEKTASMCGIVGFDGKLRFHDSKGLHTFVRGKTEEEKRKDEILGTKDAEDSSDLNILSGSLLGIDLMPTTSFAGAFIPQKQDLGSIKEEKTETEEKKPEAETKPEAEKPAETPSPSQS